MPSALLYGHSQTGGMGLDMRAALQAAGFDVTLSVHNGKTDAWLLDHLPELGDLGPYKRVVAYLGGNATAPDAATIVQLAQALGGPDKVAVVLPPLNADKAPDAEKAYRNAAHVQALQGSGFRVYIVQAPGSDFWDGVHLNPGSVASQALAEQVMADWKAGAPWWAWALGIGLGLGAYGLWKRRGVV